MSRQVDVESLARIVNSFQPEIDVQRRNRSTFDEGCAEPRNKEPDSAIASARGPTCRARSMGGSASDKTAARNSIDLRDL